MNKKRLTINMIAQVLSFAVNIGVSFVLTPFIYRKFGEGANTLTAQANNFVGYAQIIVSALNTMANRFITVSVHKENEEDTKRYFSSLFFGNLLLAALLTVPLTAIVFTIDRMIEMNGLPVADVKVLYGFVFLNLLISIVTSVFGISTYAKNRLDLTSVKTIQADIGRTVILILCFSFFPAYIWYIGITSVLHTCYIAYANVRFTKQLLPGVRVERKYFDWKTVKELVSLGAWNALTRVSQMLLDGLDLLISGIFFGAASTDPLTYAKYVPMYISNLMGTIAGVFNPQITIAYAAGGTKGLVREVRSCNRIMIFLMSIPIAFLTAYGDVFYRLWMPELDAVYVQTLTLLTIGTLYVSMSIQVLYHVFIITKKVKENSFAMIISGVLTTLILFVLLQKTNLGLYAIAGVSSVIGIIRNLTFTPLYAARCLKVPWRTFYSDIGMGILSIGCITALGFLSKRVILPASWLQLIALGCVMGVIALLFNFLIILRKDEKQKVMGWLGQKLKGGHAD